MTSTAGFLPGFGWGNMFRMQNRSFNIPLQRFGKNLRHRISLFAFEPQAKGSEQVIQVFPETL